MLSQKISQKTRPIFFRGISLRQYVLRSSEALPPLQYKDDQTIFVDQDQRPVFVDDVFIYTDSSTPLRNQSRMRKSRERTLDGSPMELPTLHLSQYSKQTCNKGFIERNSTDDSIPGQMDCQSLLLPHIVHPQRKSLIRERNVCLSSRSSSRSVFCRKRVVPNVVENEERRGESGTEKRLAKGVCVDGQSGDTKSGKKKEVMRAYSLVRNKRVRKGAAPIREF